MVCGGYIMKDRNIFTDRCNSKFHVVRGQSLNYPNKHRVRSKKNWAIEKCHGNCSDKRTPNLFL